MKTLYILRHAQKDAEADNYDYDIKLTQKGLDDSKAIGQKLKERFKVEFNVISVPVLAVRLSTSILSVLRFVTFSRFNRFMSRLF